MKLTAFDFETCGHPAATSIVELGVCVIDNRRITEQRSWRMAPGENSDFDRHACQTHKITQEDVAGLPTFDELWPQIRPYFECNGLIAHNLAFDYRILHERVTGLRAKLDCDVGYCTQEMAKSVIADPKGASLPITCENLGVKYSPYFHHRAVDDARMSAECFLQLSSPAAAGNEDITEFAKRLADLGEIVTDRVPGRGLERYDGLGSMSTAAVTISLDEFGLVDSADLAAERLDNGNKFEDIAILAERVKAITSSVEPPQIWSGWAFSITGEECGMERKALAEILQQLGAKCDAANQAFAKTGKAAYGPTNALVFSVGGELNRLQNDDPNRKFKSVAEDIQKNGPDGTVAILSAGHLYKLTISAAERSTPVTREAFVEETLVKNIVRPSLRKIAANLPPSKRRGRPRAAAQSLDRKGDGT